MTRRGRFRGSTAQTYLRAVRGNPKLQVLTDAQAGTLIFDGQKCVGVTYRKAGQMKECRATKEVILCGGAYNSPQLLQVSGIGISRSLKEIGVEVRAHDLLGLAGIQRIASWARLETPGARERDYDEPTVAISARDPGSRQICAVQWRADLQLPALSSTAVATGFRVRICIVVYAGDTD